MGEAVTVHLKHVVLDFVQLLLLSKRLFFKFDDFFFRDGCHFCVDFFFSSRLFFFFCNQ